MTPIYFSRCMSCICFLRCMSCICIILFAAMNAFATSTVKLNPAKKISVIATLAEPPISGQKPIRYNHRQVISFLKKRTAESSEILKHQLMRTGQLGKSVKLRRLHWINNSITAVVNGRGLRTLAGLASVRKIYLNGNIMYESPYTNTDAVTSDSSYPYDYADIKLDRLIAEFPNITGTGVTLGSVDTGVDGTHPALKGKITLFMDGQSKQITDPYDSDSHGTHTVGTMIGGDRRNFIGMAPDAKMVATAALFDYDSMLFGMEWMLDPDKNANTFDAPRAVNNSWHAGGAPDMELFYKAVEAWEAAGILPVFSAGNAGRNGDKTITHPKEHPLAFAVGATGFNGTITDFSSRGPGQYHGQNTQKPEITAPGEKINSSLPSGSYGKYSGTSMASPHVTGVIALLLQAHADLNPQQLRAILRLTAVAVPVAGSGWLAGSDWNKVYGFGKLDAYAAVKAALDLSRFKPFVDLNTPAAMQARFILMQGVDEEFHP